MIQATSEITILVLLFGALVVLAILLKGGLERIGAPPLVGYLLLGLLLRWLDQRLGLLGRGGEEVLDFLARIGVAVLLFRVGFQSNLQGLIKQLRRASGVWAVNLLFSGAAGYLVSRYVLSLELIPSLMVAVAMTATSVGIPTQVWQKAGALETRRGELFLDVAELDDLSGVVLMGLLFAVLPALREAGEASAGWLALRELGLFGLKLTVFMVCCYLFSRFVEERYTRFFCRLDPPPDLMLVVMATGLIVAALAGLLGFSIAIGAFFAGLVFSRDPQRVRVKANFNSLYDLFSPFFFVGVGLALRPESLAEGFWMGGLLLAAAVGGKLAGTVGPVWPMEGWRSAVLIGVSMVPRAEIAMVIMRKGLTLGDWAVPQAVYNGMVVVSAASCLVAPPVLRWLLRGRCGGQYASKVG